MTARLRKSRSFLNSRCDEPRITRMIRVLPLVQKAKAFWLLICAGGRSNYKKGQVGAATCSFFLIFSHYHSDRTIRPSQFRKSSIVKLARVSAGFRYFAYQAKYRSIRSF